MRANLTTICSSEVQEEIRYFLSGYLSDLPISDSEKNQIILAIDEGIANAIIHGNDSDPNQSIVMDLDINDSRIMVELSDIGLFDAKKQSQTSKGKDLKEVIKERQKGGLGLKLIYSIMDVVCFYTKNNQSHCMMIKLLGKKENDS